MGRPVQEKRQRWDCSTRGGYLTQKGAAVMDCPSRTFPETPEKSFSYNIYGQIPWPVDQGINLSNLFNNFASFDPGEPFWTSGGKATWSDGDELGSVWLGIGNTHLPGTWSQALGGEWWWMELTRSIPAYVYYYYRAYSAPYTYLNGICGGDYYTPNVEYCNIIGSYQIRPDDRTWWHNSYKLDRIQGKAVASDAIWGWFHRSLLTNRGNGWTYAFLANVEELRKESWVSNHDMAYNVLFTDGSVKTFSDAGLSLFKSIQNYRIQNGGNETLNQIAQVYRLYFDPLYAQDQVERIAGRRHPTRGGRKPPRFCTGNPRPSESRERRLREQSLPAGPPRPSAVGSGLPHCPGLTTSLLILAPMVVASMDIVTGSPAAISGMGGGPADAIAGGGGPASGVANPSGISGCLAWTIREVTVSSIVPSLNRSTLSGSPLPMSTLAVPDIVTMSPSGPTFVSAICTYSLIAL